MRRILVVGKKIDQVAGRRRTTMQYIAFDSHKHYTQVCVEDVNSGELVERRLSHDRGALREFLECHCERGSPVALETIGNWYWIVDEVEQAGFRPRLVHARKAKLMMGMINKTDKLDARGLNLLQRNGTLPVVWIPPSELRDQRDLPRTRMVLVRQRTRLKNRIQATLAKYALSVRGVSDTFGTRGRRLMTEAVLKLPKHAAFSTRSLLEQLDFVDNQTEAFEQEMLRVFAKTPEIELLMTMPGVGFILAVVITLEVGDIRRFPSASRFASYAGTTPRIHSSGGKTRHGRLRPDVNRYLKWAFVEAGNVNSMHRRRRSHLHTSRLYEKIKRRGGCHAKAIVALARHLAEATYWILTKKEAYREPGSNTVSSTRG
jgi:transposase